MVYVISKQFSSHSIAKPFFKKNNPDSCKELLRSMLFERHKATSCSPGTKAVAVEMNVTKQQNEICKSCMQLRQRNGRDRRTVSGRSARP